EKPGIKVPAEEELKAALASAESTAVTPWKETTVTRELVEHKPEPAAITSTRKVDEIGLTIVKFANGVEAWLKPTDFKNDQVLFAPLSTHGFNGSAVPAQLETALQLLYARFTEPGDDPEVLDLMKRQLAAAVANRLDNPETVFGDK